MRAIRDGLSPNQLLAINMTASLISLLVTFGISFILSPYIVRTVGVEAYGFVSLGNNFVSYASLATVALDALAGRFITVRLYEGDIEQANKYYASAFYANLAIGIVLLLVGTFVWVNLERLVSIPDGIVWDVKILFGSLFLNCFVSTVGSVFAVATFATNKLYLNSLRSIESQVIRAIALTCVFALLAPRVWYIGATALLTGVYCLGFNIHYTRVLTPMLKLKRKSFDSSVVMELLASGVWSLVNRLGVMLHDGLDLLITNLFIDATSMGVLSLAKTVPGAIQGVIGSLVTVFAPNFTILYAEGKIAELVESVRQSMKIMGVMANLPIIILVVCGEDFFHLWQPTQDAAQLYLLSILTIAGFVINGGVNCIFNIFTVVNRLKVNSVAILVSGLISAGVTYLLVRTTNLGVVAVAGTSTVVSIARNLLVTIPYAAICLDLKWYSFYLDVIRQVLFFCLGTAAGLFVRTLVTVTGWLSLCMQCVLVALVAVSIGLVVMLNENDRARFFNSIRRRVGCVTK